MSLDIPDEARKSGWDALERAFARKLDLPQVYASALEAALPLVVAAELDRLADDYRARWQPDLDRCNIDPGQCKFCNSIRSRIEEFTLFVGARARELRGGTHD